MRKASQPLSSLYILQSAQDVIPSFGIFFTRFQDLQELDLVELLYGYDYFSFLPFPFRLVSLSDSSFCYNLTMYLRNILDPVGSMHLDL